MAADTALRRQLLERAHALAKAPPTADASMMALAALLDTLGKLLSAWTGEAAVISVSAAGRSEMVKVVGPGPAAGDEVH